MGKNIYVPESIVIAGRTFQSRLLVGTGKYKDFEETKLAIDESGAQIVTVAIRRVNLGQDSSEPSLLVARGFFLLLAQPKGLPQYKSFCSYLPSAPMLASLSASLLFSLHNMCCTSMCNTYTFWT